MRRTPRSGRRSSRDQWACGGPGTRTPEAGGLAASSELLLNPPDHQSSVWADLIQGRREAEFEFLGARMLVVRIRLELAIDPSPKNVARGARELCELFDRNRSLRSAQNDVRKLAGSR